MCAPARAARLRHAVALIKEGADLLTVRDFYLGNLQLEVTGTNKAGCTAADFSINGDGISATVRWRATNATVGAGG